jgi:hypothetical protein
MSQPVHVTFIHGLANKPSPQDLRRIWLDALAAPVAGDQGLDLDKDDVTASFLYWADLFFERPLPASDYESADEGLAQSLPDEDPVLEADPWTDAMRKRYAIDEMPDAEEPPVDDVSETLERIPLPWFIKQRVMCHFLQEAHDYFFNVDGIRDEIWKRGRDDFAAVPEDARHVLVGHSQGSFIAYDLLTAMPGKRQVAGFLTLGSPLGVDEVQDCLPGRQAGNGFPELLTGDWYNVYDPFDVVARADPELANDFLKHGQRAVIDICEPNWGRWRHSATKYFQGPQLRRALRNLCGWA